MCNYCVNLLPNKVGNQSSVALLNPKDTINSEIKEISKVKVWNTLHLSSPMYILLASISSFVFSIGSIIYNVSNLTMNNKLYEVLLAHW